MNLEMEEIRSVSSESDWDEVKVNPPIENELEEGEIGEEGEVGDDDEIFVLGEFDPGFKRVKNLDTRLPKDGHTERIPFITFTDTARKVTIPESRRNVRPFDNERRSKRENNRSRNHRSISPSKAHVNTRNNSNRPQMSGYSMRRQSILRSIHRRTRSSYDSTSRSRNNRSYDDLLAEYQDIKSKLRHLVHEENNLVSDEENSNEGSYGDKENRVCQGNSFSRPSRSEVKSQINKHRSASSSSDSEASIPETNIQENEEEEVEEDILRKIALASKSQCKKQVIAPLIDDLSDTPLGARTNDSSSSNIIINGDVDAEEEDEDLLRARLLSSITLKQLDKSDISDLSQSRPESVKSVESVSRGRVSNTNNTASPAYPFPLTLPVHEPVVINLKEDSDSEPETISSPQPGIASISGIDDLLRTARSQSDAAESAEKCDVNSTVQTTPLSVYNLSKENLKEYQRLKAEIVIREQGKNGTNVIQKTPVLKKMSNAGKLKLAEDKFLRIQGLLNNEEKECTKLTDQLPLHEKSLKSTELSIKNLEQQLVSVKKLRLFKEKRLDEIRTKKTALEEKIKLMKSKKLSFQRLCFGFGKIVRGKEYKLPEPDAKLKKVAPKVFLNDKKLKNSVKKPRSRQSSIGTNPGTNKLANELALEKTRLQKKQQELVSKLAELRKQTLRVSTAKANAKKTVESPIESSGTKHVRRVSLTKKSKKPKLSESNAEAELPSVTDLPSKSLRDVKREFEKRFAVDNALNSHVLDSMFEFHHLFIYEIPKINFNENKATAVSNHNIPESLLPYHSPLLSFRAYRFSPYFRTKSNQNLSWSTYCHGLNPKITVCRYDLFGKCNDDKCKWQHAKNYLYSPQACLKDLLAYAPQISEDTSAINDNKDFDKLDAFVSNLLQSNQERMTLDEMCVLLVGRVNDHLNKVPPHFITFNDQNVFGERKIENPMNTDCFALDLKTKEDEREGAKWRLNMDLTSDGINNETDVRYFQFDTLTTGAVEPVDELGWISLAKSKLNRIGCDPAQCLDMALDILSRALEKFSNSFGLWLFYLNLYSKRQDTSDLLNLFRQAVAIAPCYDLWWQYLQSTNDYKDKVELCKEILQYCVEVDIDDDMKSHQILEILLYWIKLNILTSNFNLAISVLEVTLLQKCADSSGVLSLVFDKTTPKDRCLIWLCYISLTVFHDLPNSMFSSENSGLGKIVSKLPFVLPWHLGNKWHIPIASILNLFMNALRKCVLKGNSTKSNAQLCLPLYKNLIALELSRQRNQSAIKVCEQLRNKTSFDEAWITQAWLYYRTGNVLNLRKILHLALSESGSSPILYCFAIMTELKQKNVEGVTSLCRQYLKTLDNLANSSFETYDEIDVMFRHLLDFPFVENSLMQPILRPHASLPHKAYVWLIYCMYLISQDKVSNARSVFEIAILRLTDRNDLEIIWLHYLEIYLSQRITLTELISLLIRCFKSVPCKVALPGNSGDVTHVSYVFLNFILDKYIVTLALDTQISLYEKFLDIAPNNSHLAIRLLTLYINKEEYQVAWRLCCTQIERTPRNLDLWKIALRLAFSCRSTTDIREVFKYGTEVLPFSEFLWNEFIAFEVAKGEREYAQELVTKCRTYGIQLSAEL